MLQIPTPSPVTTEEVNENIPLKQQEAEQLQPQLNNQVKASIRPGPPLKMLSPSNSKKSTITRPLILERWLLVSFLCSCNLYASSGTIIKSTSATISTYLPLQTNPHLVQITQFVQKYNAALTTTSSTNTSVTNSNTSPSKVAFMCYLADLETQMVGILTEESIKRALGHANTNGSNQAESSSYIEELYKRLPTGSVIKVLKYRFCQIHAFPELDQAGFATNGDNMAMKRHNVIMVIDHWVYVCSLEVDRSLQDIISITEVANVMSNAFEHRIMKIKKDTPVIKTQSTTLASTTNAESDGTVCGNDFIEQHSKSETLSSIAPQSEIEEQPLGSQAIATQATQPMINTQRLLNHPNSDVIVSQSPSTTQQQSHDNKNAFDHFRALVENVPQFTFSQQQSFLMSNHKPMQLSSLQMPLITTSLLTSCANSDSSNGISNFAAIEEKFLSQFVSAQQQIAILKDKPLMKPNLLRAFLARHLSVPAEIVMEEEEKVTKFPQTKQQTSMDAVSSTRSSDFSLSSTRQLVEKKMTMITVTTASSSNATATNEPNVCQLPLVFEDLNSTNTDRITEIEQEKDKVSSTSTVVALKNDISTDSDAIQQFSLAKPSTALICLSSEQRRSVTKEIMDIAREQVSDTAKRASIDAVAHESLSFTTQPQPRTPSETQVPNPTSLLSLSIEKFKKQTSRRGRPSKNLTAITKDNALSSTTGSVPSNDDSILITSKSSQKLKATENAASTKDLQQIILKDEVVLTQPLFSEKKNEESALNVFLCDNSTNIPRGDNTTAIIANPMDEPRLLSKSDDNQMTITDQPSEKLVDYEESSNVDKQVHVSKENTATIDIKATVPRAVLQHITDSFSTSFNSTLATVSKNATTHQIVHVHSPNDNDRTSLGSRLSSNVSSPISNFPSSSIRRKVIPNNEIDNTPGTGQKKRSRLSFLPIDLLGQVTDYARQWH